MYQNDSLTKLIWEYHDRLITVDRTFALNAAYEEIRNGLWWIPAAARDIDNGDFYAQMKAPTRIRDAGDGQVRYRWVETGPLEHYRHAQAYDYLGADVARRNPPAACCGMAGEDLESVRFNAYYGRYFGSW